MRGGGRQPVGGGGAVILANGELYESAEQEMVLSRLEAATAHTRATKRLPVETVIQALDTLGRQLERGDFDELVAGLGIDGIEGYVRMIALRLKRETIAYTIRTELGDGFFMPRRTAPPYGQASVEIRAVPLGTLLHIAAGNVDGLPVYSVFEGLLTGNVNILKLPQADNGLSIEVLRRLIAIEPAIADFVYVFDTPSSDLAALQRMAAASDGIVVWGGDEAVAAVRRFAPPGVKLIEWGHKLSFAYIAGYTDKEAELTALADHILETRQLLCSSCQVIYLDTDSLEELRRFCAAFLPYLEAAARRHPERSIGMAAEVTLRRYADTIERVLAGEARAEAPVFRGERCCLTACPDSELELSDMFGSCLVKRLPREQIMTVLRRKKGYLQTVGLLCPEEQRPALTELFAACGLVRITRAGTMSASFCGEAHDGDYPLRRYVRIVNVE